MPIKFDDAAQHVATLPDLGARIAGFISTVRSRLQAVDGRDALQDLIGELDQHHDLMVRSIAGDAQAQAAARRGPLGPGETPFVAGDRPVSVLEADRNSNPISPVDSSGFRVHPAEALTMGARATNPARGAGFGGNGVGASADVRTQAALAAQDLPTRSLQEQQLQPDAVRAENIRPDSITAQQDGKRIIPVIRGGVQQQNGPVT